MAKSNIQTVIDSGVVPKIIKDLEDNSSNIVVHCVCILGNISTGSVEQIDDILRKDALQPMENLLNHYKTEVRIKVCFILSNITAGN
jgi:importin subunit alpha-2